MKLERMACRCFEGAIAATAAPLVGVLAERMFGFSVCMHRPSGGSLVKAYGMDMFCLV